MKWIFLIFFGFNTIIYSQINQSFDSGESLLDQQWSGTLNQFTITDEGQLQLNGPSIDSLAYLFIPSVSSENATWQLDVQMDFNPSSNNYSIVYLIADSDNPEHIKNAYYLFIGSSNDDISLYRQYDGHKTLLIDGIDGRLSFSKNDFSVRVIKTGEEWVLSVYIDGSWIEEGTSMDSLHVSSNYFGLFCDYTSSRSDLFYFDNIMVTGDPYIDSSAFVIEHVEVSNPDLVQIEFSKDIDESKLKMNSFQFQSDEITIDSLSLKGALVTLHTESNIPNKTHQSIDVSGIYDEYGYVLNDTIVSFDFIEPERFDLVISEFMVDPEPAIELPEFEYIELFNRTEFEIDLQNCYLMVQGESYLISDASISAHSYLLLLPKGANGQWAEAIDVTYLNKFPSLVKSQNDMVLVSNTNVVLDAITYNDLWENKTFKDEGGWSFEIIDLDNRSGHFNNWEYSNHLAGGTPGYVNSVKNINLDREAPFVKFITVSDSSVQIYFSEPMNIDNSLSEQIHITGGLSVDSVCFDSVFLDKTVLYLMTSLDDLVRYELVIDNSLSDFNNNKLMSYFPLQFGKISELKSGDIVINEVLFNPTSEGVDFIEIYNRSDKTVNLSDLFITEIDDSLPKKLIHLSEYDVPIVPESYWVSTSDTARLFATHDISTQYWILELETFPSMPNNEGNIAITNKRGEIIDQIHYYDSWHYSLLNSTQGVSLERIQPDIQTQSSYSWHSASEVTGYSTPGAVNSQYQDLSYDNNELIHLRSKLFTPDSDGMDDLLMIDIDSNTAGGVINIVVYKGDGGMVTTIANNVLLGSNNSISWNGTDTNGARVPPGIYILWSQVYYPDGRIAESKKAFVIGVTAN